MRAISSGFSVVKPKYDELVILGISDRRYRSCVQPFVSACEKTLVRLEADLCHCKLQYRGCSPTQILTFCRVSHPPSRKLLRTTRTRLDFVRAGLRGPRPRNVHHFHEHQKGHIHATRRSSKMNYEYWSPLDAVLCCLVDRLCASGYKHTLEAEIHESLTYGGIPTGANPATFFPRFREKGRVIVFDEKRCRVIYCSDGLPTDEG